MIESQPTYIVEKGGRKSGLGYEIMVEVMKRMNCPYTEQVGSFSSVLTLFSKNAIDIFGFNLKDTQIRNAEFIPVWRMPRYLVVRKSFFDEKRQAKDYVGDPKIIFGNMIRGKFFLSDDEVVKLFKEKRLKEYPLPEDVFRALDEGKIQAAFGGPFVIYHYVLKTKKMTDLMVIEDHQSPFYQVGFFLSKSRLSPSDRSQIREIFKGMQKDGTLFEIAKKYASPEFYKYLGATNFAHRLSSHKYRDSNSSRLSSFDYRGF